MTELLLILALVLIGIAIFYTLDARRISHESHRILSERLSEAEDRLRKLTVSEAEHFGFVCNRLNEIERFLRAWRIDADDQAYSQKDVPTVIERISSSLHDLRIDVYESANKNSR